MKPWSSHLDRACEGWLSLVSPRTVLGDLVAHPNLERRCIPEVLALGSASVHQPRRQDGCLSLESTRPGSWRSTTSSLSAIHWPASRTRMRHLSDLARSSLSGRGPGVRKPVWRPLGTRCARSWRARASGCYVYRRGTEPRVTQSDDAGPDLGRLGESASALAGAVVNGR